MDGARDYDNNQKEEFVNRINNKYALLGLGRAFDCGKLRDGTRTIIQSRFKTERVRYDFGGKYGCIDTKIINIDKNTEYVDLSITELDRCPGLVIKALGNKIRSINLLKIRNEIIRCNVKAVKIDIPENRIDSCANWFEAWTIVKYIDLRQFNMSRVKTVNSIFKGCYNLEDVEFGRWGTPELEIMNYMFYRCMYLENVNLAALTTKNVTHMVSTFSNCNICNLDLTGLDTRSVKNFSKMFFGCKISRLDVSWMNTESAESMTGMFDSCEAEEINLSGFDTRNVTTMESMFRGCDKLKSLKLGGISTDNVVSMAEMFYGCEGIELLDLSMIRTTNVRDMSAMFKNCSVLRYLDISSFRFDRISKLSDTENGFFRMFGLCTKLDSRSKLKVNLDNLVTCYARLRYGEYRNGYKRYADSIASNFRKELCLGKVVSDTEIKDILANIR